MKISIKGVSRQFTEFIRGPDPLSGATDAHTQ